MVSLCFTQISLCFRGHQSLSGRFTGAVQGRIGAALRQGVTVTTHRSGRDHRGSQGITGRSKISIRIATVIRLRGALCQAFRLQTREQWDLFGLPGFHGDGFRREKIGSPEDCGWFGIVDEDPIPRSPESRVQVIPNAEQFWARRVSQTWHTFSCGRGFPVLPCWNVQFGFLVRCLPSPSDHFPVFVNFMLKVKGAARRVSVVSAVSCQCRSSKRKSAGRLWEASRMREAGELHGVETSHENMLFRKIWKTLWTSSVMIRCDSWRSTTVFHGISTLGTVVHGVSAVCCQHEFLCQGMAGVCGWQREGATRVASIARTESWTEGATLLAIFQLNRVELNVKIGFVRICGFPHRRNETLLARSTGQRFKW